MSYFLKGTGIWGVKYRDMGWKGTEIWGQRYRDMGTKVQGYGERQENPVTNWYLIVYGIYVATGTGIWGKGTEIWGKLRTSEAKVQRYGEKLLISSEVFFVDLLHFSFYASLVQPCTPRCHVEGHRRGRQTQRRYPDTEQHYPITTEGMECFA